MLVEIAESRAPPVSGGSAGVASGEGDADTSLPSRGPPRPAKPRRPAVAYPGPAARRVKPVGRIGSLTVVQVVQNGNVYEATVADPVLGSRTNTSTPASAP